MDSRTSAQIQANREYLVSELARKDWLVAAETAEMLKLPSWGVFQGRIREMVGGVEVTVGGLGGLGLGVEKVGEVARGVWGG